MPEPKKPTSNRAFEAQVDSALDGLHLVRPANPAKPSREEAANRAQLPATPEEPGLVSKLIDFIKTM